MNRDVAVELDVDITAPTTLEVVLTDGDVPEPGHVTLPGPHRVASLLKRWNAGTHHYRVEREHLQYYLDKFTFRFNRRRSKARGMLFYRLLQQTVNTDPHPLADLIGGAEGPAQTPR